jgi:hypothetical protein
LSSAEGPDLNPEVREHIHALACDLPRVWKDPRTPARERKRMLRLLVEDVTLVRDRAIRIQLRWKGGATTSIEQPLPLGAPDLRRTPAAIIEEVRALATEQTDQQIARTLNARGLRTGTGQPFRRLTVRYLRATHGIEGPGQHLRRAGWLTVTEIATQLHIHRSTAKRFGCEGVLRAARVDDKGDMLFEPPSGALPRAHPGKRFRDRRRYPQLAPHVRKGVQYAD